MGQKIAPQLSHTAESAAATTFLRVNVNAFDESRIGGLGDHVGLKADSPPLCKHPHATLLDAPSEPLEGAFPVTLKRVHTVLFQHHHGVDGRDLILLFDARGA